MSAVSEDVWLLDANVFMAMLWPHHQHHATAHHWFSQAPKRPWASCAITQSAFVRLSLNERIHGVKIDYEDVLKQLKAVTARTDHRFWEQLPAIGDLPLLRRLLVQGNLTMTDSYLLSLVKHHRGRLATFDTGIPTLLPTAAERRRWVELITP